MYLYIGEDGERKIVQIEGGVLAHHKNSKDRSVVVILTQPEIDVFCKKRLRQMEKVDGIMWREKRTKMARKNVVRRLFHKNKLLSNIVG